MVFPGGDGPLSRERFFSTHKLITTNRSQAARRNMTKLWKKALRCHCRGRQHVLDEYQQSQTVQCYDCQCCTLIMRHPNFDCSIALDDFDIKRGSHPDQRPLDDLTMATAAVVVLPVISVARLLLVLVLVLDSGGC